MGSSFSLFLLFLFLFVVANGVDGVSQDEPVPAFATAKCDRRPRSPWGSDSFQPDAGPRLGVPISAEGSPEGCVTPDELHCLQRSTLRLTPHNSHRHLFYSGLTPHFTTAVSGGIYAFTVRYRSMGIKDNSGQFPSLFAVGHKTNSNYLYVTFDIPSPTWPYGVVRTRLSTSTHYFPFTAEQQMLLETGPTWRKFAIVFNTTSGDMEVAIDGQLIGTRAVNPGPAVVPFADPTALLILGNEFDGVVGMEPEENFMGEIDDFQIFENAAMDAVAASLEPTLPAGTCDPPNLRVRLEFEGLGMVDCGSSPWGSSHFPHLFPTRGGAGVTPITPHDATAMGLNGTTPPMFKLPHADTCGPNRNVAYRMPDLGLGTLLRRSDLFITASARKSTVGRVMSFPVDVRPAIRDDHLDLMCTNLMVYEEWKHQGTGEIVMRRVDHWIDAAYGCAYGFPLYFDDALYTEDVEVFVRVPALADIPSDVDIAYVVHATREPGFGHELPHRVFDLFEGFDGVNSTLDELVSHTGITMAVPSSQRTLHGQSALAWDTITTGAAASVVTRTLGTFDSSHTVGVAWHDDSADTNAVAGEFVISLGQGEKVGVVPAFPDMISVFIPGTGWSSTGVKRTRRWHRIESRRSRLFNNVMVFIDGYFKGFFSWATPAITQAITVTVAAGEYRGSLDTMYSYRTHDDSASIQSQCGNGVVNAPEEECDDGNYDRYDGCRSCRIEPGYVCTGTAPSVCDGAPPSCRRFFDLSPERPPDGVYKVSEAGPGSAHHSVWCDRDADGTVWTRFSNEPPTAFNPSSAAVGPAAPLTGYATVGTGRRKLSDAAINTIALSGRGTRRYYRVEAEQMAGTGRVFISAPRAVAYSDDSVGGQSMGIVSTDHSIHWCVLATDMGSCAALNSAPGTTGTWLSTNTDAPGYGNFPDTWWSSHILTNDCTRLFTNINPSSSASTNPAQCWTTDSTTQRCWNVGASCPPSVYQFTAVRLSVSEQLTSCGDGVLQWHEECDDGNLSTGDGCSPRCRIERMRAWNSFVGFRSCAEIGGVHPSFEPGMGPFGGRPFLLGPTSTARFTTRCMLDGEERGADAWTRVIYMGTASYLPTAGAIREAGALAEEYANHPNTFKLRDDDINTIAGPGKKIYRLNFPNARDYARWYFTTNAMYNDTAPSMGLVSPAGPCTTDTCSRAAAGDWYANTTQEATKCAPAAKWLDSAKLCPWPSLTHLGAARTFVDNEITPGVPVYHCTHTPNPGEVIGQRCAAETTNQVPPINYPPYSLDLMVREAECGDGVRASHEECDDGNRLGGDGCSSACRVEHLFECTYMPAVGVGDVCAVGRTCHEAPAALRGAPPVWLFDTDARTSRIEVVCVSDSAGVDTSGRGDVADGRAWLLYAATSRDDGGLPRTAGAHGNTAAREAAVGPTASAKLDDATALALLGTGVDRVVFRIEPFVDPANRGDASAHLARLAPILVRPNHDAASPGVPSSLPSLFDGTSGDLGVFSAPRGLDICHPAPASAYTPLGASRAIPAEQRCAEDAMWRHANLTRWAEEVPQADLSGSPRPEHPGRQAGLGLAAAYATAGAGGAMDPTSLSASPPMSEYARASVLGNPGQLLDTAWMSHAGADDCARLRIDPGAPAALLFASGSSCAPHRSVRIYVRGAKCGDGVLDTAAGEACDDGNTVSNDGCSADCSTIEETTCASIHAASPATASGPQTSLRHRGATTTHAGWCDMTTDGGGWQLASKFSSAPGGSGLNATALAAAALPWTHGTSAVTAPPTDPSHVAHDSVASHDWRRMLVPGTAAEVRTRCETSGAGADAIDLSYRFAVPARDSSSNFGYFSQGSPGSTWEVNRRISDRAIPLSRRRVYANVPGADLGDPLYGESDATLHPPHAWTGAYVPARRRETMRLWLPYTTASATGPRDTRVTPCASDAAVLNTATPASTWCIGSTASAGIPPGAAGFIATPSGPVAGGPSAGTPIADPGFAFLPDTRPGRDVATLRRDPTVYGTSGSAVTCTLWLRPVGASQLPTRCDPAALGSNATGIYILRARVSGMARPVLCDFGAPPAPFRPAETGGGDGWMLLTSFSRNADSLTLSSPSHHDAMWQAINRRQWIMGEAEGLPADDLSRPDLAAPFSFESHRWDEFFQAGDPFRLRWSCRVYNVTGGSNASVAAEDEHGGMYAGVVPPHGRFAQYRNSRIHNPVRERADTSVRSWPLAHPTPLGASSRDNDWQELPSDAAHFVLPTAPGVGINDEETLTGCYQWERGVGPDAGGCNLHLPNYFGATAAAIVAPSKRILGPAMMPWLPPGTAAYVTAAQVAKPLPHTCAFYIAPISNPDAAGVPDSCASAFELQSDAMTSGDASVWSKANLPRTAPVSGVYLVRPRSRGARRGGRFGARSPLSVVHCDMGDGGPGSTSTRGGEAGPGWLTLSMFVQTAGGTVPDATLFENAVHGSWILGAAEGGAPLDARPSYAEATTSDPSSDGKTVRVYSLDWSAFLARASHYWLRQRCELEEGPYAVDAMWRFNFSRGHELVQAGSPAVSAAEDTYLLLEDRRVIVDNTTMTWAMGVDPATGLWIHEPGESRFWLPLVLGVTTSPPNLSGGCIHVYPNTTRTIYAYRSYICSPSETYDSLSGYRYWGAAGVATMNLSLTNVDDGLSWLPIFSSPLTSNPQEDVGWSYSSPGDKFRASSKAMRCSYHLREGVAAPTLVPVQPRPVFVGGAGTICLRGADLPRGRLLAGATVSLEGGAAFATGCDAVGDTDSGGKLWSPNDPEITAMSATAGATRDWMCCALSGTGASYPSPPLAPYLGSTATVIVTAPPSASPPWGPLSTEVPVVNVTFSPAPHVTVPVVIPSLAEGHPALPVVVPLTVSLSGLPGSATVLSATPPGDAAALFDGPGGQPIYDLAAGTLSFVVAPGAGPLTVVVTVGLDLFPSTSRVITGAATATVTIVGSFASSVPQLLSVTPASPVDACFAGPTITVHGSNLLNVTSALSSSPSHGTLAVGARTPTSVELDFPAGALEALRGDPAGVKLTVTSPIGPSAPPGLGFAVLALPNVTSVEPRTFPAGSTGDTVVTVYGHGFPTTPSAPDVTFPPLAAATQTCVGETVLSASTAFTCRRPAAPADTSGVTTAEALVAGCSRAMPSGAAAVTIGRTRVDSIAPATLCASETAATVRVTVTGSFWAGPAVTLSNFTAGADASPEVGPLGTQCGSAAAVAYAPGSPASASATTGAVEFASLSCDLNVSVVLAHAIATSGTTHPTPVRVGATSSLGGVAVDRSDLLSIVDCTSPVPSVTAVQPASGPATGGTTVTLYVLRPGGGVVGSGAPAPGLVASLAGVPCVSMTTVATAPPHDVYNCVAGASAVAGPAGPIASVPPGSLASASGVEYTYVPGNNPTVSSVSPATLPSESPPPGGAAGWASVRITVTGSLFLSGTGNTAAVKVRLERLDPAGTGALAIPSVSVPCAVDAATLSEGSLVCAPAVSPLVPDGEWLVVVENAWGASPTIAWPGSVVVSPVPFSAEFTVTVEGAGGRPVVDEDGELSVSMQVSVSTTSSSALAAGPIRVRGSIIDPATLVPHPLRQAALTPNEGDYVSLPATFVLTGVDDGQRDGNATVRVLFQVENQPTVSLRPVDVVVTDARPRVERCIPEVSPMLGGVTVTVSGLNFDPEVRVLVFPDGDGNDIGTGSGSAYGLPVASTLATLVRASSVAHRHANAYANANVNVRSSLNGTGTVNETTVAVATRNNGTQVVFVSPVQGTPGYRSITIENLAAGNKGTASSLILYTKDCPAPGSFGEGLDCGPCPEGGYCPGGFRIRPLQGYWNPEEGSGYVVACDPPTACIGCTPDMTRDECYNGGESPCSPGYVGFSCAQCDRSGPVAYYKTPSGECELCPAAPEFYLSIAALILLWIVINATVVFVRDRELVGVLCLFVISVQEIAGVGQLVSHKLPGWIKDVYQVLWLFSGDLAFVRPDCESPTDANLEFLYGVAFAVLLGFPMHVLLAILSCASKREENIVYYRARAKRAVSIHAFLVYLSVTSRALRIVACLSIGGEARLAVQPATLCYEGMHLVAMGFGYAIILGYTIGFPVMTLAHLWRNSERVYTDEVWAASYDFFPEAFRPSLRHAWTFEIGISASLAMCATVLVKHPRTQFGIAIMAFSAFFIFVAGLRPFTRRWENIVVGSLQLTNIFAMTMIYLADIEMVRPGGLTERALLYTLVALAAGVLLTTLGIFLHGMFTPRPKDIGHDGLRKSEGGLGGAGVHGGGELGPGDLDDRFEFEYEYDTEDGDGFVSARGGGFSAIFGSLFAASDGDGDQEKEKEKGQADGKKGPKRKLTVLSQEGAAASAAAAAAVAAAGAAAASKGKKKSGGKRGESDRAATAVPDLVRVVSLPSVITAKTPEESGESLLDAMRRMLGLDGPASPPPFWSSSQGGGAVDVTGAMRESMQRFVNATILAEHLGTGRDHLRGGGGGGGGGGSGKKSGGSAAAAAPPPEYTGLEVVSVERIENAKVYEAYAFHVAKLRRDAREEGHPLPSVNLPGIDAASRKHLPDADLLDAGANEKILLHGLPKRIADVVVKAGFDARVARKGMFSSGSSLYFALNASKCDEYASSGGSGDDGDDGGDGEGEGDGAGDGVGDDGIYDMIVSRVCIGQPFVSLRPFAFQRPPCIRGHTGGHACAHRRCDSILAPTTKEHTDAVLTKHMEVVVFDNTAAYPAYRVRYRRK